MVQRNSNLAKLRSGYLFPEISRRRRALQEKRPDAKVISLGIGDTTEPLPPHVAQGLSDAAAALGRPDGYTGYGVEQGMEELRRRIAGKLYGDLVAPEEVSVSDGAKCDVGRLQVLFGSEVAVAVQDPSYPVYVDSSVILGQTGAYVESSSQFEGIVYMTCGPENGFFPDLDKLPRTDLIYFCSPNNPTGAVATEQQLKRLVDFAANNRSIIIFDAAYSAFIRDKSLPTTIFSIEGARNVAIETNSFSKTAGFTGVRLGWTIVPNELKFDDGTLVRNDWSRIVTTLFNGASNVVQHGGMAVLDDEGLVETRRLVDYYMENGKLIKSSLAECGIVVYGGENSPYIWAKIEGKTSWDAFEEILEKTHVVTTPGSGFGPAGEGFVRFSSFGHREDIEEAVSRLRNHFSK